jgi:hypothetical protein
LDERSRSNREAEMNATDVVRDRTARSTAPGPRGAVPRPNPFKGLAPFDVADARDFMGRDADAAVVTANVLAYRLTVLYGPTGVGKSSLLRAGVLPRLYDRAQDHEPGARRFLPVFFSSWNGDPCAELARAMQEAAAWWRSPLHSPPGATAASGGDRPSQIARLPSAEPITFVLLLDQFEEFFNLLDRPTHQAFCDDLVRLVTDEVLDVNVLFSIREDAIARLDHFKGSIPRILGNRVSLRPMSVAVARTAMQRPVERQNADYPDDEPVTLEPELIEAILETVAGEDLQDIHLTTASVPARGEQAEAAVDLPLLQIIMAQLWTSLVERGERHLTTAQLAELGGPEALVRRQLESGLAGLPRSDLRVAVQLFDVLVTPSGMKIALSAEDTAEMADVPLPRAQQALTALVSANWRLLRPVETADGTTLYEIYHDVLTTPLRTFCSRYLRAARWNKWSLRLAWLSIPIWFFGVGLAAAGVSILALRLGRDIPGISRRALLAIAISLPSMALFVGFVVWPFLTDVSMSLFDQEPASSRPLDALQAAGEAEDGPSAPVIEDDATELEVLEWLDDVVWFYGGPSELQPGSCYTITDPDSPGTQDDPLDLREVRCQAVHDVEFVDRISIAVDDLLFLRLYNDCGAATPDRLGIPSVHIDRPLGDPLQVDCLALADDF